MDVKTRSLASDKKKYKSDNKKEVKEAFSPKEKDDLIVNPSSCSTNWSLLANRLAKLEDQLSKLDAQGTIGDHLRKRSNRRSSRSSSSKRESDSSDETSKRSSKTSLTSQSSRTHTRSCSPDVDYYGSLGSDKSLSEERVGKDIHELEEREETQEKDDTGSANRRPMAKRSTAVLEYFADKAENLKPGNARLMGAPALNKHAAKSAVIQNFSDRKINDFKASRGSLTKENIKKFIAPPKERLYRRMLTKRDIMLSRTNPVNSSKSRPKVDAQSQVACEPSSTTEDKPVNQESIPPVMCKTKSTATPKKCIKSFTAGTQQEPIKNAENAVETTTSKTSKDSIQTSKKPKIKKENSNVSKQSKKKKTRVNTVAKTESVAKKKEVKPKPVAKPKKASSIRTPPEKKQETRKYSKSAKFVNTVSKTNVKVPKRGSSVSKIGSTPRMSTTSSFTNNFKETPKRGSVTPKAVYCALTSKPNCFPALFKSKFEVLSQRPNFGFMTPTCLNNLGVLNNKTQRGFSPKPKSDAASAKPSYTNFRYFQQINNNDERKSVDREVFRFKPPSQTTSFEDTTQLNVQSDRPDGISLFPSSSLVSDRTSTILAPKTRHLTDMEVQILVKDVEQISGQIQKYIKKWDEVLKTNTTADRDEDIRKTVLSACVLLDTKLKRAKELLMKYKALTSDNNGLGSPTAEMLEALLYYQLTQLDVASVIKTFRRLDSMLTSDK